MDKVSMGDKMTFQDHIDKRYREIQQRRLKFGPHIGVKVYNEWKKKKGLK